MRALRTAAVLAALLTPLAQAQVGYDLTPYVPRITVATGYQFFRSNSAPATADYFENQGGFTSVAYTMRYWLRAVAKVSGTHGDDIGPLHQSLNLGVFTAGPEVLLHVRRFEPFADVLLGVAHGGSSYFPSGNTYSTSATSFAVQTGVGLDYNLNHRIGLRLARVEYLHTGFPNGANNSQNHLLLGGGITFKFGSSYWTPDPGHERAKARRKSEQAAAIPQVAVAAPAAPPVVPASESPATPSPSIASASASGGDFHDRVKDALFEYDSYALGVDAVAILEQDAAYLKQHPEVHVRVGGYSDERGTAEYNLALGEKRAQAARDALVARGVSPDQLEVISYGKEVQVCNAENESCFQQNRRAGFEPRR